LQLWGSKFLALQWRKKLLMMRRHHQHVSKDKAHKIVRYKRAKLVPQLTHRAAREVCLNRRAIDNQLFF